MNVVMVGSGYVGLVSGACFAEMGNTVTCVDVNKDKIDGLKKGVVPIYEPGLEELIKENIEKNSISFSTSLKESLHDAHLVFIAVGTPQGEDGSADLQYVLSVANEIGSIIEAPLVVVNKSTVPVGTADLVRNEVQKALDVRGQQVEFSVVSNPEFLKEGAAIEDFLKPDRVVVGSDNEQSAQLMRELYKPFMLDRDRYFEMDLRSAELTKYAANAMLATKVSFMNEVSQIAERVGADINKVRVGIGSDSRIGYRFIFPGCGYGGSCFPKDVQALRRIGLDAGYTPRILTAVEDVNADQKKVLVERVKGRFGADLSGKSFAIWGLSFKPETDDMREAASITIVKELAAAGATLKLYDPKAKHEAQEFYLKEVSGLAYAGNKYDALNDCDAMLLVTEWKEFRSPDFAEIKKRLKQPIIIDGRNQYPADRLANEGFEYYQIGVPFQFP